MADDRTTKPKATGWGAQIVLLYETFLLRDVLGYAFPGAVLLFGLYRMLGSAQLELDPSNWAMMLLGLSAAYAAGVFLRLAGTWTHLLVIAHVRGLLGDPWDLKPGLNPQRRGPREIMWKSPHESMIFDQYKRIYAKHPISSESLINRETTFLHLAGNLGFATLILFVVSVLPFVIKWNAFSGISSFPPSVNILLFVVSMVLIPGHYRHARAIQLFRKAGDSTKSTRRRAHHPRARK